MEVTIRRRLLALLLVLFGLAVFALLLRQGSPLAYAAAIPIVAGLFLGLPADGAPMRPSPRLAALFLAAGWALLGLAMLATARGPRHDAFFFLVPASLGAFLLASFVDEGRRWHAFAGALAIFVLVRWSSYHAFATFAGNDSFFHAFLSQSIVESGHVAPISLGDKYTVTPGMHIVAATAKMATGLGLSDALFWSVTVSQLALPLALVAWAAPGRERAMAIWVAALLAIDSTMVLTTVNFTPGSYTIVLLAPLLLSLRQEGLGHSVVFLVAAAAAVVMHQLSTFVMLAFYGAYAGWLALARLAGQKTAPLVPLVRGLALVVGYLLINGVLTTALGSSFFQATLRAIAASFSQAGVGDVDRIVGASGTSLLTNFLFKLALVFTSSLAIAASVGLFLGRGLRDRAAGAGALFVILLAFGLPFIGVSLAPDRWLPVALVVGLLGAAALLARWSPPLKAGFLLALTLVAFFGVTQPAVAIDQSFYATARSVQVQFNERDVATAQLLSESGQRVNTDFGMVGLLRVFGEEVPISSILVGHTDGSQPLAKRGLLLVREELLLEDKLHFKTGNGNEYAHQSADPAVFLGVTDRVDRIADAGGVTASWLL